MINKLPNGLLGLILLFTTINAYSQKFMLGQDTTRRSIVSDSTWLGSTEVSFIGCGSFPWIGAVDLPVDESFTSPVNIGQPYGYSTIDTIAGASVIKSGSGVHFFRTTFSVEKGAVITDCRFRVYVDDDVEIYINNTLLAREGTGIPANYKGAPHDLMFYDFGPYYNPYLEHDPFDYVLDLNTNDFIVEGENELILAVRNKVNDAGGFTFRMDYSYVLNPEWIDIEDTYLAEFQVFPNPTNGLFRISSTNQTKELQIKIYNYGGQHILSSKGSGQNELELDLSGYAPGMYWVQMSNDEGVRTRRIIKL